MEEQEESLSKCADRSYLMPPPLNSSHIREITITPLDLGFVVRVGCQTVAFTDKQALISAITKYLNNPEETEKAYYNDHFGKRNQK